MKTLSKNCNFNAVSVEVYRTEMIRDSFISGLSSNYIRQGLLEKSTFDYNKSPTPNESGVEDPLSAAAISVKSKRKCFFCGGHYVPGHQKSC